MRRSANPVAVAGVATAFLGTSARRLRADPCSLSQPRRLTGREFAALCSASTRSPTNAQLHHSQSACLRSGSPLDHSPQLTQEEIRPGMSHYDKPRSPSSSTTSCS